MFLPPPAKLAGGGPPAERSEEPGVEGASGRHDMKTRNLMTGRARALRTNMSEPEVMLWSRLRGWSEDRPTFRRQHPFGSIIVDFYCPAAGLAIEVDGRTHW